MTCNQHLISRNNENLEAPYINNYKISLPVCDISAFQPKRDIIICNSRLTEVGEPAEMGNPLVTGAHRHRSILPPGVKYVPKPLVLRRILFNRSYSLIANSNGHLPDSLKTTA